MPGILLALKIDPLIIGNDTFCCIYWVLKTNRTSVSCESVHSFWIKSHLFVFECFISICGYVTELINIYSFCNNVHFNNGLGNVALHQTVFIKQYLITNNSTLGCSIYQIIRKRKEMYIDYPDSQPKKLHFLYNSF